MINLFAIKLFFAGMWPVILDYIWPIAAIIAIILIETFSSAIGVYIPVLAPLLEKLRKDFLWLAVAIAVALAWGAKMQHDDKLRCDAKANVVVKQVDKAVTKSKTSTKKDKFEDDDL